MPDDVRKKGEDGLGQFRPALFVCKAPYQSMIKRRTEDPLFFSGEANSCLVMILGFKEIGDN